MFHGRSNPPRPSDVFDLLVDIRKALLKSHSTPHAPQRRSSSPKSKLHKESTEHSHSDSPPTSPGQSYSSLSSDALVHLIMQRAMSTEAEPQQKLVLALS